MNVVALNVPQWWSELLRMDTRADLLALRDAVKAAGVSKNDRINVEKIWTLMLMRKLGNKKES